MHPSKLARAALIGAFLTGLGACQLSVTVADGNVNVGQTRGGNDIKPSTLNPVVDATVTDPNVQVNGAGDLSRGQN